MQMLRSYSARCFTGFALLLVAAALSESSPWAALWTAPCILLASLLIAWGAEAAQYFVAQGFALAILAWMQTLPEFAVEAVLAWKQQTDLLLANLTGALRLLTGLAWPAIYLTAAIVHRRRDGTPLRKIHLDPEHSIEVVGLIPPLLYALFIWWKGDLHLYDAVTLVAFYVVYLVVLTRLPPQSHEGVEDLEAIPRAIVRAPRTTRILAIAACFLGGGTLVYFTAEPFLGSLVAVAAAFGLPSFIVIQWLAPIISEFPELASTFYFARQEGKARVALMNITSSNINQWTLLVAMLPVVFSMSHGAPTAIVFDADQETELLLTIGQSAVALVFLINMEFAWWEALAMFVLFAIQFVLPAFFGESIHIWIAAVFFVWTGASLLAFAAVRPPKNALSSFISTWRAHIVKS
jgi:cation:H+ antiporter